MKKETTLKKRVIASMLKAGRPDLANAASKLDDLLYKGTGWKKDHSDSRETVLVNQSKKAVITVRHGAAYIRDPVVLEQAGKSKRYFHFVPEAIEAIGGKCAVKAASSEEKPSFYVLKLRSSRNPDRPFDKDYGAGAPPKDVKITKIEDAPKVVTKYISDHDLGGGNWTGDAGMILLNGKTPVARVSYNGRIWVPKHKGQNPRDWKPYAQAVKAASSGEKLSSALRSKINQDLIKAGLDGNGRFHRVGEAINVAHGVFAKHGIEEDEIFSANRLHGDKGRATFHMAFTNKADLFSPVPISNSVLVIQWYKFEETGKYEVLMYMS